MPQVLKRDKRTEELNPNKVFTAIFKCLSQHTTGLEATPEEVAKKLSDEVVSRINGFELGVEEIQDLVETVMMEAGLFDQAKAYILYRNKKAEARQSIPAGVEDVEAVERSNKYFQNELGKFVFYRSYSRWLEDKQRRETWEESVERVISYYKKRAAGKIPDSIFEELHSAMLNMEVMPSMRSLSMAGPAMDREGLVAFNCAAIALDSIQAFCDLFYVLQQGTGCGFSVEYAYTDKLPRVKPQKKAEAELFIIPDSTEGWCDALKLGMTNWFSGKDVVYDYCLAPSTKVLTTDLRWVTIDSLVVGDHVIGFDSELRKRCPMKDAEITSVKTLSRPCYKIITDKGEVISSAEHKWVTRSGKFKPSGKSRDVYAWKTSEELSVGNQIAFSVAPWEEGREYEDAYMAGLLDGEGYCSTTTSGLGQKEGVVLDKSREILTADKIQYKEYMNKNTGVVQLVAYGKWNAMKMVGHYRPIRLLNKSRSLWEGRFAGNKCSSSATIQSIEYLGDMPVIALGTTTETFIAEGFLSHNSLIRPAGARLKTKGGFASGSQVLKQLLDFTRAKILSKQGDRLQPIDCHDIACFIAHVVVAGAVRRSATISISNLEDEQMRHAKDGAFYNSHPYRGMSNNSWVLEDKISSIEFMEEWLSLAKSGTGERGIYNRQAANKTKPRRRKAFKFLPNPSIYRVA